MKRIFIAAVIACFFSTHAYSDDAIAHDKRQLIDKLLEQTGQSARAVAEQFSDMFVQQMIMLLKQSRPDIDARAFDIVEDEVTAVIREEMVESNQFNRMIYPVYSKHFTKEELAQIIEINNSDVGRKMIEVMPLITQESMQAGQHFGQTLGPQIQQRIMARFEKEGIH